MQHGDTGPDDATVYRPQAPPPEDEGTRIIARPSATDPATTIHGADEGTRIIPRKGTTDDGAPDSTRIVPRGAPQSRHASSWVSDASWAKHTGTPSSIPPISAAEVPTFPQFGGPHFGGPQFSGQHSGSDDTGDQYDSQKFNQDYSAYALPEDRFAAPPEARTKQRATPPLKSILGWAFAVILLAVAAGVGYVTFLREPPQDPNVHIPATVTASVQIVRGDEVVRQYLQALAAGDIDKARTFGPLGGEGSTVLLSKQVYAESLRVAPITEISVPTTDENATDIPATYKLGTQEISTRFRVRKLDSGSWQMEQTTVTFRMQGTSVTNVPLIVNGVRVDWDNPLELAPGMYKVSTGLPFITYSDSDSLTVLHLGYTDITSHPITPVLAEAGTTAFKNAVTRSLNDCASRKELSPANCPMSFEAPAGKPLVPGSVTWTLTENPVPAARAGLLATDQSKAEMTVAPQFTLSLEMADGGRLNNTPVQPRAIATAVMTVTNESLIAVEWRNV